MIQKEMDDIPNMKHASARIIVIIPACNEESNIEAVVRAVRKKAPEADYLVINDCSRDNTRKVCRRNHFNYLDLPVNLGIGGGMQAGYRYALEKDYDIAIQLDGDGQHDPAYIQDLVAVIRSGGADVVIGSRFVDRQGFQSSWARRLGITFLSSLIRLCCGVRIKDVTSGYRAVNRRFIKIYASEYAQDYPEPEAIICAALHGARISEVPVMMQVRSEGTSSIHSWRSVYYMIKVSLAILLYWPALWKRWP